MAVKKLLALLIGITSKYESEFYCLNCLYSFGTNKKVKRKQKWSAIYYLCKSWIFDRCKGNPENSSTMNVGEYVPSGFSISTLLKINSMENKRDA